MPSDKNRHLRIEILDRCFSDLEREYSRSDLMSACGVSRATLHRDLRYIRGAYKKNLFDAALLKRGKYRYSTPGFTICEDVLDDVQLGQIKSVLLLLRKFMGKPQFEYLNSVIRHLEKNYQVRMGDSMESEEVIHFDGNPYVKGMEWLVPLFEAIIKKQCKQVVYQPFDGAKRIYIVHPYILKEYNQRWYLLCHKQDDVDRAMQLRTLSLDRVEEVNDIVHPFSPAPEDLKEYFEDFIGITNNDDEEVQNVVIKCSQKEFNYLRTRPLHPTQRTRSVKEGLIQISVKPNYELYQWLLFYGDQIEVVEPQKVRDKLKRVIQNMLGKYK
jgi:predicted DNA-binding transcriptional regulator YafY